jgi:serine/threonine protein kinase
MTCPSCGAANEPAAEVCFSCRTVLAAVSRGTVLAARYEILELLGRGGMGTVYRRRSTALWTRTSRSRFSGRTSRPLPAWRSDSSRRSSWRGACLTENVCRSRVRRKRAVCVSSPWSWWPGKSLKDLLVGGPLPAAEALDAVEQAARGLVAIHDVGIVHRDLKPANLTRDGSGRVRVMDFGIAKAAGIAGDTTAGYLLGSPEYMSPSRRGGGALISGVTSTRSAWSRTSSSPAVRPFAARRRWRPCSSTSRLRCLLRVPRFPRRSPRSCVAPSPGPARAPGVGA